jgi:SAM-dependent methyltransferase
MLAFDPERYKATTRERWDTAAQAWYNWAPTLQEWLGPATEIMLDMAGVKPASRVLDVAAGAGGQTLDAASRVGPSGSVLATDISSKILEFAQQNALSKGYNNISTRVLDGENLDVEAWQLRCSDFAGRPDLFPRSTDGTHRHTQGAEAGRQIRSHRLFYSGAKSILLHSRVDHSPPCQLASTCTGSAGTFQPRRRRRIARRAEPGWFR